MINIYHSDVADTSACLALHGCLGWKYGVCVSVLYTHFSYLFTDDPVRPTPGKHYYQLV